MSRGDVHPACRQMRDLRIAAGLSLAQARDIIGMSDVALGSYERGDRQPPLHRAETILNGYGYTLVAVPKDFDAVRLRSDMAQELRAIANQLDKEKKSVDVSKLPHAASSGF